MLPGVVLATGPPMKEERSAVPGVTAAAVPLGKMLEAERLPAPPGVTDTAGSGSVGIPRTPPGSGGGGAPRRRSRVLLPAPIRAAGKPGGSGKGAALPPSAWGVLGSELGMEAGAPASVVRADSGG